MQSSSICVWDWHMPKTECYIHFNFELSNLRVRSLIWNLLISWYLIVVSDVLEFRRVWCQHVLSLRHYILDHQQSALLSCHLYNQVSWYLWYSFLQIMVILYGFGRGDRVGMASLYIFQYSIQPLYVEYSDFDCFLPLVMTPLDVWRALSFGIGVELHLDQSFIPSSCGTNFVLSIYSIMVAFISNFSRAEIVCNFTKLLRWNCL